MTNKESHRLLAFQYASHHRFKPSFTPPSRRSAKSKRNATGQLGLKSFRVVAGVGLEKLFIERKGI